MPESLFWARYLFRIHVARQKETERQVIRKEAQTRTTIASTDTDLKWEAGILIWNAKSKALQSNLLFIFKMLQC